MRSMLWLLLAVQAFSYEPNWSQSASIPLGENRKDLYQLGQDLESTRIKGLDHVHTWPVEISGLFIPYRPLQNFFNLDSNNPLKVIFNNIAKFFSPIESEEDIYSFLGLNNFQPHATGIYQIPLPNNENQKAFGAGIVGHELAPGMSFSCAACHSANLFGTTVIGLTNKVPRANEFFKLGKSLAPLVGDGMFQFNTNATNDERELFARAKRNLKAVGVKKPPVLGLDTSLSQVALSLARRNQDAYATKNRRFERNPRQNHLKDFVAASKPMPWWNLKYKTRWLSDGSIVSGNPIFTNFLWNELGRGTDLYELEEWLNENEDIVKELTATAFATEAPLYTDFFPAESIDINKAKRGEQHYLNSCKKCHGVYHKAWNSDFADELVYKDKLKTIQVDYHEKTPVKNVGTDPNRYIGMRYFATDLNNLEISKNMNTLVIPQEGYVPPPLVGVWSRWPYLHNNSIPSLCALLTKPSERPRVFYVGPALDKERHFDQECNGYPIGDNTPREWRRESQQRYDTRRPGMSNQGHSKAFINEDGSEKYTWSQKMEIIEFLKTL